MTFSYVVVVSPATVYCVATCTPGVLLFVASLLFFVADGVPK